MTCHAEACLKELGLAHRVVTLAAGDTGFSAQFAYDIAEKSLNNPPLHRT
ncbi:MAG: hypothetical protein HOY79_07980 [Streptomyces sp.]|nr:hypothetical protein [Streptomyces sp.]